VGAELHLIMKGFGFLRRDLWKMLFIIRAACALPSENFRDRLEPLSAPQLGAIVGAGGGEAGQGGSPASDECIMGLVGGR